MSRKMKILIAYDGSSGADAALDDLSRAGLPPEVKVVVLSVAEPLPPPEYGPPPPDLTAGAISGETRAQSVARQACGRIRSQFPQWETHAEAVSGSPAREVIGRADQWQPDLIIVGSHGRAALGRFFLGSVSHLVANEAHCSVRVARGHSSFGDHPLRIVVAFDGSPEADAAVRAVASRTWPPQTGVRIITALGPLYHATAAAVREREAQVRAIQKGAEAGLQEAGLRVSTMVSNDDPKRIIVLAAEYWGADAIFIGAGGPDRSGRSLLGTVSTAVVSRAHCSVEVVRREATA